MRRREWVEHAVFLAIAFGGTLKVHWRMVTDPHVFQSSAMLLNYWTRHFQDPALFNDGMTAALRRSGFVPLGVQFLYFLGAHVVDAITFGEVLGIVLAPLAAWLVFLIIREITPWKPGAWLGAAVFWAAWDVQVFSGGHARAFGQPILLAVVLLALRKRDRIAAFIPPIGYFLYPTAAVDSLAIFGLSALKRGRPPIDVRRASLAVVSAVLIGVAAFGAARLAHFAPTPVTRAETEPFAEFQPGGYPGYAETSLKAFLKSDFGGFGLKTGGAILVVIALALLVLRPRNAKLLPREVWSMAIGAFVMYGLAHLVAFRLYLPHRHTESLIPFAAITVGVAWRPTWEAIVQRLRGSRARVAVAVASTPVLLFVAAVLLFPLGPEEFHRLGTVVGWYTGYLIGALVIGLVVAFVLARREQLHGAAALTLVAAIAAGSLVAGEVAAGSKLRTNEVRCNELALDRYIATLPNDAVVAGDPHRDPVCIPVLTNRAVVINTKLYQPYEEHFFRDIRARMTLNVRAYWGRSVENILALRRAYGADYFIVRRQQLRPLVVFGHWTHHQPFFDMIKDLRFRVRRPASLKLPKRCMTSKTDVDAEVYDLACVERVVRS